MDADEIRAEMAAVVAAHGPWGTHNVALPFGAFTLGPEPRGDNHRAVKFVQLVADLLRRPFRELRVLDLGCGEGLYAIEFAQHGAEVVGIEGREANFARAEFARRALALPRLRFELGDVRDVSRETHGRFDVVLCSGILYHLDAPACFHLIHALRGLCDGLCLVDTRIASAREEDVEFEGRAYAASRYREHAPGASEADRLADVGASLDNEFSVWLTRAALSNALADAGFTSVLECLQPVPLVLRRDRVTLAAFPGPPVRAFQEVGRDLLGRRWPLDFEG